MTRCSISPMELIFLPTGCTFFYGGFLLVCINRKGGALGSCGHLGKVNSHCESNCLCPWDGAPLRADALDAHGCVADPSMPLPDLHIRLCNHPWHCWNLSCHWNTNRCVWFKNPVREGIEWLWGYIRIHSGIIIYLVHPACYCSCSELNRTPK